MRPDLVLFARKGSTGIPRKSFAELNGRPLCTYTFEFVQNNRSSFENVVLSSDDEDLLILSQNYGITPLYRDPLLATSSISLLPAWKDALSRIETPLSEFTCTLPLTSPTRLDSDVFGALKSLYSVPCDGLVTISDSHRNPFFNMVSLDGTFINYPLNKLSDTPTARQDAPVCYDINTVFFGYRTNFVLTTDHLYNGRITYFKTKWVNSIDIDTPDDIIVASAVLASRGKV